jgi:periplasmic copper chaperone A
MNSRFLPIMAGIFLSPFLGAALSMVPVAVDQAVAAAPAVTVSQAWARASAGAATTGAAYVTLTGGASDDTLIGVSAPVADTVQVHESSSEGGVMRMRQVTAGVPVPAGKTVVLRPGGYHIMMIGLHQPLVAGHGFPLTLTFAHAAPVTVPVTVQPIGAAAAGHDSMSGSMPGMTMPMSK